MARASKGNLLPPSTRDELVAERSRLQTLLGEMDQAEACGVDCQHYKDTARKLIEQLDRIIGNAYADHQPVMPAQRQYEGAGQSHGRST